MNEFEFERKHNLEVLESFLANLSPETVEKIRFDLIGLPESGFKRFSLQAVDEVEKMKSA